MCSVCYILENLTFAGANMSHNLQEILVSRSLPCAFWWIKQMKRFTVIVCVFAFLTPHDRDEYHVPLVCRHLTCAFWFWWFFMNIWWTDQHNLTPIELGWVGFQPLHGLGWFGIISNRSCWVGFRLGQKSNSNLHPPLVIFQRSTLRCLVKHLAGKFCSFFRLFSDQQMLSLHMYII